MPRTAVQDAPEMGRPPSDKPKAAILNFRVYPEVREAVEAHARKEHRTVASMAELLLREAIVARMKRDKEDPSSIEGLP